MSRAFLKHGVPLISTENDILLRCRKIAECPASMSTRRCYRPQKRACIFLENREHHLLSGTRVRKNRSI